MARQAHGMENLMRALALIAVLLIAVPAEAGMLDQAKRYVGMSERTHARALKAVIGVNPRRVPWCGAFVGAMARKTGRKPPAGYMRAAGWRKWGRAVPISIARPGDVVVMRHHVTIFSRKAKGRVCGIGGNQKNTVRESCYRASRVIAVRRAG